MSLSITFSHFEKLIVGGYSLDILYLLQLIEQEVDVKVLCDENLKLFTLFKTIYRKGLITEEYKLTTQGKELLTFTGEESLPKQKKNKEAFDIWWTTYPGTDTFTYKGKSFSGTRSLRCKKEDCKIKFNKILGEGEFTIQELVEALKFEILQKMENSFKTKTNKLSYMQNSLTYLNQRTFEGFIELIRQGHKIKLETQNEYDGVNI